MFIQKGALTSQSAVEAEKASLLLLGNASVQTAKERRKKGHERPQQKFGDSGRGCLRRLPPFCLGPHSKQR